MKFFNELNNKDLIIIAGAVLISGIALVRMIMPESEDADALEREVVKAQLINRLQGGVSFNPNDDERIDMLPQATPSLKQLRDESNRVRANHPTVMLDRMQFDEMFNKSRGLHEKQMEDLALEAKAKPSLDDLETRLSPEDVKELEKTGQMVW